MASVHAEFTFTRYQQLGQWRQQDPRRDHQEPSYPRWIGQSQTRRHYPGCDWEYHFLAAGPDNPSQSAWKRSDEWEGDEKLTQPFWRQYLINT